MRCRKCRKPPGGAPPAGFEFLGGVVPKNSLAPRPTPDRRLEQRVRKLRPRPRRKMPVFASFYGGAASVPPCVPPLSGQRGTRSGRPTKHLYGERQWTMQRIGEALGVSQQPSSKPARPNRGRPKWLLARVAHRAAGPAGRRGQPAAAAAATPPGQGARP